MSNPHSRTTEKNNDHSGGGPGSSHQGGSHGHATRSDDKANSDTTREPGTPTNPDRSRVSGGGGERDVAHTHDTAYKSSKHSSSKND
ncbi:hypothetical protein JMJ56_15805 [Belnapia sp. T18]|uniref:Uncharacterized protein n=1 Tax=Belnapia arida TaxID=2804533 RepID=A0ABS1U4L6_9PROT|nr:hypothetical protein [Belnapia arida]MBL6079485.1 hypothetical protein [Belnapia arida]